MSFEASCVWGAGCAFAGVVTGAVSLFEIFSEGVLPSAQLAAKRAKQRLNKASLFDNAIIFRSTFN